MYTEMEGEAWIDRPPRRGELVCGVDRLSNGPCRTRYACYVESRMRPVGLLGPRVAAPWRGTGVETSVDVLQVLTTGSNGRQWLVPAYRFEGMVRIKGVTRAQRWAALVPAALH
jgi:hypothetical protein